MGKFNFILDQKVEIWERIKFTVKAESQEEANKRAVKMYKDTDQIYDEDCNTERHWLYDTASNMTPKDNNGQCTKELYVGNMTGNEEDIIATNAPDG